MIFTSAPKYSNLTGEIRSVMVVSVMGSPRVCPRVAITTNVNHHGRRKLTRAQPADATANPATPASDKRSPSAIQDNNAATPGTR